MITGAVFDIDGTLLDSMGIWDDLGERYLKTIGKKAEPGLGKLLFPMSLEEGCSYLRDHYDLEQSLEDIQNGVLQIIRDYYVQEVTEKSGVIKVLQILELLGIPMVLATTGDRGLSQAALDRLGLSKYFRGLLTCTELATTKKEPLIYYKAAALIGCRPENTVVFEDSLQAIITAKRAGFHTIAVEDPSSADDMREIRGLADHYLTSYHECSDFMDQCIRHSY